MRLKPRQKRIRSLIAFRIAAFFIIGLIVIFSIDALFRPVVKQKVRDCAKNETVKILNRALLKEIDENDFSYSDFVHLKYGENGKIVSVETDTTAVNRFKAQFVLVVTEALYDIEHFNFSLKIGTLIGPEILSERGPEIHFSVTSSGLAQTEIYSSFEESGINQTIHKIKLAVSVNVRCYFPGYCTTVSVRTDLSLAETIIIGDVPQVFAPRD